jgi:hypothetical protein
MKIIRETNINEKISKTFKVSETIENHLKQAKIRQIS